MSKSNTARKSADVIDISAARKGKTEAKVAKATKAAKAETPKAAKADAKPKAAAKVEAPKAAKGDAPKAATKAGKGTVKVAVRTATIVGKATDAKAPRAAKGHFLFAVGKTIAQQALATNEVTALPGKIPAAAKELLANGGTVSKATVKAAGLDFAALTAKLQESRKAHVIAKATTISVTPHADKANIVLAAPAPVAKTAKASASTQVRVQTPATKTAKTKAAPVETVKAAAAKGKATKADAKAPTVKVGKAIKNGK